MLIPVKEFKNITPREVGASDAKEHLRGWSYDKNPGVLYSIQPDYSWYENHKEEWISGFIDGINSSDQKPKCIVLYHPTAETIFIVSDDDNSKALRYDSLTDDLKRTIANRNKSWRAIYFPVIREAIPDEQG